MYRLFYSPGACSMAVHVVLNEMGVPFALDRRPIPDGATRTPEFLKINPRGQIPVLQDGTEYIKEGAAILIYLMDKHQSALLPREGIARARALEWLCWCNATLHNAYSKAFWAKRAFGDKPYKDDVLSPACAAIQALWDEAEERLGKSPFLAGDSVSAADIMLAVMANWGQWMATPPVLGKNVLRVIRAVIERPAYRKALEIEQVEYKAAA